MFEEDKLIRWCDHDKIANFKLIVDLGKMNLTTGDVFLTVGINKTLRSENDYNFEVI